jgi:hypothetical protein
MSEEKKPKIDLKARLGKTSGASIPPAGASEVGEGIPAPVVGAAVAAAAPAPAAVAPQPVLQRFEIDESEV